MVSPVIVAQWPEQRPVTELFFRLPAQPGRFLIESQGGPSDIARYSFFGHQPFQQLIARGKKITLIEGETIKEWTSDPLEALQQQLDRFPVALEAPAAGSPPFPGGAVGYLSYDLGRQIEHLPNTARNDLQLPDLYFSFYDHLIAIDHQSSQIYILAVPVAGRETQALRAAKEIAQVMASLADAGPPPALAPASAPASEQPGLTSNFTRPAYRRAVKRALDYIARGHIYQVNLAQRFRAPLAASAEALYLRLRTHNPAPFAAFLHYPDFHVISASPERFLHFDPATRRVETRPIKGTRPRGETPEADEHFKTELLISEKDNAELVMIVDLERNDLGRVCDYGTVHVPDLRRLEPYPTVWHTVATIAGHLRPDARAADLLRAAFPGGSITGAPKIRAMQIIEELEGLRRHVYCGAIGYVSFSGQLDFNIAIRTITIKNDIAYFHAGGGVVADSDPDGEYDETLHKARALAHALGITQIDNLFNAR